MVIKSAEFVKSSARADQCPPPEFPEYAFTGRSNVGKSSVLNMLTGKRKLAKTSSTPGKTQLINHFLINNSWYLADLPGYGYAKASRKMRKEFSTLIMKYIENRKNLVCLFVLVDSRHAPLTSDMNFIRWLGENLVPFVILFTKCDKLPAIKLEKNINVYLGVLKQEWENLPQYFCTSALKQTGKDQVLDFINETNAGLATKT